MNQNIENEISRLKNLKNFKNKSDEDLLQIAKINVLVKEFSNSPLFQYDGDDPKIKAKIEKDQDLAVEKFETYLTDYKIESSSDIDTLKSLVFTEMMEVRVQREINQLSIEGRPLPKNISEQLIEIQNQKSALKIKLGIDKTAIKDTDLTKLEKAEIRFQRYIEEHKHEFTLDVPMICEKCNHEAKYNYLLRKRVKDFDAIKNPWFAGRFFFNYEIIKDVKNGKITKEDAWRYMSSCALGEDFKQTAFSKQYCADYIDWCISQWGYITSLLEIK